MLLRGVLSPLCVLFFVLGFAQAEDKPVPDDLLKSIKADDPDVRIKAIMGLSKLGKEAVPVLVEALKDSDAKVSNAAAYGLLLLKLEPAERLAALRPYLADKNPLVRNGVAGALARGGQEAVASLVSFLKDEEVEVRKTAVRSLHAIAQKEKESRLVEATLPELEKALKDEASIVRLGVVQALPSFGPKAIPLLVVALDDKEAKVRAYAAAALSKPAYKPLAATFTPALAKRLKGEEEIMVKQSLLSTLSKCGPEMVPVIRAALTDKDPEVQKAALTGLGQIGLEAKAALPAVKELATKAEHPDLRKTAVSVLARFGPEGMAAVLDLLKLDDSATRLACLQVIGKQGGAGTAQVPSLSACLKDKEEDVRALAAFVLGKLGPDAKAALPDLQKLLEDRDKRVRDVAEKAIKSIGGN
jgi:HEAT repeat protein